MSIGYACMAIGVPHTCLKSCRLRNASVIKLLEIIAYNLNSLENLIDYNIKNKVKLFRISSDLIPFGSNAVNNVPWWAIYSSQLLSIGEKIQKSGMRVSMHPGQYTVLSSPKIEVISRAIEDLNYHVKVLDSLGLGAEHKIVLHIGGIYNDKKQASKRFIENYHRLDTGVKQRLVLENDDKSYHISDVLEIGMILNTPVIFDNLHNKINPSDKQIDDFYWISECRKTWKEKDGYQKIHYSQQNPVKKLGSHSESILIDEFLSFYQRLEREDIDIMLEVKDKNLSAIKCINCTSVDKNIKALELEWSKYKYSVLEKSPTGYIEIQKLLQNKYEYPAISFYTILEGALQKKSTIENSINASQYIWSFFEDIASDKERNRFFKNIGAYQKGEISMKAIKNILWKMAVQYNQLYLLDSYYFVI